MRIGEFLIDEQIITQEQLDSALKMQADNPGVLLGDIFITLGILTRQQLLDTLSVYIKREGGTVENQNEWLTQSEVDDLILRIQE